MNVTSLLRRGALVVLGTTSSNHVVYLFIDLVPGLYSVTIIVTHLK